MLGPETVQRTGGLMREERTPDADSLAQAMAGMATTMGQTLASALNSRAPDIRIDHFAPSSDLLEQTRDFRTWLENFQLKLEARNLSDPAAKLRTLRSCLGATAVKIIDDYTWPGVQGNVYENYVARAKAALMMRRAKREARSRFGSLQQEPGEDLLPFFNKLSEGAELCEFGAARDERILDRMVSGCRDPKWRERVMEDNLTLDEAVKYAQLLTSIRTTNKNIAERNSATSGAGTINAVRNRGPEQRQGPPEQRAGGRQEQRRPDARQERTCDFCTYVHRREGHCPSWDKVCHECGTVGHFAASPRCRGAQRDGRRRRYDPSPDRADIPDGRRTSSGTFRGDRHIRSTHDTTTPLFSQPSQTEPEIINNDSAAIRHVGVGERQNAQPFF